MLRRALTLCVLLAAAAVPAAAQSTLADDTCVVVTSDGVFRVWGQVTAKLVDVAAFGGTLNAPSITWIDGTDFFIVTTNQGAGGGPGGVWRLELTTTGSSLVDLTAAVPAWIEPRFVDADYSPGLDTLFLLQRDAGAVVAWAKPAQTTPAGLAPKSCVWPQLGWGG